MKKNSSSLSGTIILASENWSAQGCRRKNFYTKFPFELISFFMTRVRSTVERSLELVFKTVGDQNVQILFRFRFGLGPFLFERF
mmetsp:Transcript_25015/g.57826  ORF Transcript_25015/g.57826 Transcript_25015/m.57826 type:complete len:84 (+) Transcript_25015:71-322(+)